MQETQRARHNRSSPAPAESGPFLAFAFREAAELRHCHRVNPPTPNGSVSGVAVGRFSRRLASPAQLPRLGEYGCTRASTTYAAVGGQRQCLRHHQNGGQFEQSAQKRMDPTACSARIFARRIGDPPPNPGSQWGRRQVTVASFSSWARLPRFGPILRARHPAHHIIRLGARPQMTR